MLAMTSQQELFALAGVTESELIERWKAFVMDGMKGTGV